MSKTVTPKEWNKAIMKEKKDILGMTPFKCPNCGEQMRSLKDFSLSFTISAVNYAVCSCGRIDMVLPLPVEGEKEAQEFLEKISGEVEK